MTATEVTTGRQHFGITDSEGRYRLPNLPPGTYLVQAELPGFATVLVPNVDLLVGQNATLPFTLRVAAVEETITVTGEAPSSTRGVRRLRATSIGARWRRFPSRGGTGWSWQRWSAA